MTGKRRPPDQRLRPTGRRAHSPSANFAPDRAHRGRLARDRIGHPEAASQNLRQKILGPPPGPSALRPPHPLANQTIPVPLLVPDSTRPARTGGQYTRGAPVGATGGVPCRPLASYGGAFPPAVGR